MADRYIGKRVLHKAMWGMGTVTSHSNGGIITVKFDKYPDEKRFVVPNCFEKYLQLLDTDAQDNSAPKAVKKEITYETESGTVRPAVHRNEATTYSGAARATAVPSFQDVASFCDSQKAALYTEISYLKSGKGKRTKLVDGRLVENREGSYIYSFESDSELNLPDNTQISVWLPTSGESIPATVIDNDEFTVIIVTSVDLGESVPAIEYSAETWRLINYLIDKLDQIKERPTEIVRSLVCDGKKKLDRRREIVKGQDEARKMSISRDITFVWGPPGTGKTETLARIALDHIRSGKRVLMLSYSNVSVDGAVWRVIKKDEKAKPGTIVRYGYPRDKELLQHEYLTSYNLCIKNHPELVAERASLIEERKHLSRLSPRYVEAGKELARIKSKLDEEEKNTVKKARFLATTVSKAVADSTVYNEEFDTVIFDEASMAYVPQVIFAASLAKQHFICMGDFSQLPPIVQGGSSLLNIDIFRYCGIVDAVESGCGHEWLCMLDTQYRMHPRIADFVSVTMYRGLLKSDFSVTKTTQAIARRLPFSGDPMYLADLSGMMSVCIRTADKSRINVLSAIIAMELAKKAARKNEVAVITPYSAQARLLHALSRDVMDSTEGIKKISCATVHQFQGSEKDMVIYDAVDCYRMTHPGLLLTSTENDYANRLYNVAMTRAKGKFITIVNADYMVAKNLAPELLFRRMINVMKQQGKVSKGDQLLKEVGCKEKLENRDQGEDSYFLEDIDSARSEVIIDIPGGCSGSDSWFGELVKKLALLKTRGVKVVVRTDNKNNLPESLRNAAILNKFITDPITVIDKTIVWYGVPFSKASFITGKSIIPTRHRPVFRLKGKHFAVALYGFLEMNNKMDASSETIEKGTGSTYSNLMAFVAGEKRCPDCGSRMVMKKSKRGSFFLSCGSYPRCNRTGYVTEELVDEYLYFNNPNGKRCPRDNTSLEPKRGKFGVYVCCGGIQKHFYKLDEI